MQTMGAHGVGHLRTVPAGPSLPAGASLPTGASLLAVATAAGVVPRRPAVRAHRAAKPRLRLTRRGRLVVFAFFLLLAAAAVTLAATASRAADPARPATTTVVKDGETLWSIADRHHLDGDRRAVIEEIRRLNALADYTIYTGQELKLPS